MGRAEIRIAKNRTNERIIPRNRKKSSFKKSKRSSGDTYNTQVNAQQNNQLNVTNKSKSLSLSATKNVTNNTQINQIGQQNVTVINQANEAAAEYSTTLGKLGGTLKNIGTMALQTFTDMGLSAAEGILKVGLNAEKTTQKLTAMVGDASKAKQIVDQTFKDAATTPFNFEGLMNAQSLLLATGEDANAARRHVLDLGNAVAGAGGGNAELESLTQTMQNISGAGMATAQDLNEFAASGIDIFGVLSDHLGKTPEEIARAGVSYNQLTAALRQAGEEGGKYAGAMDAANNTVGGKIDNLKDKLTGFGVQIFNDLGPAISMVLDGITGAVGFVMQIWGQLQPFIEPIIQYLMSLNLGGYFAEMFGVVQSVIGSLMPIIAELMPVLDVIIWGAMELGRMIGGLVASIMEALGPAIKNIIHIFSVLFQPILRIVIWLFGGIIAVVKKVFEFIGWVLTPITELFSFVADKLGSILSFFGGGDDEDEDKDKKKTTTNALEEAKRQKEEGTLPPQMTDILKDDGTAPPSVGVTPPLQPARVNMGGAGAGAPQASAGTEKVTGNSPKQVSYTITIENLVKEFNIITTNFMDSPDRVKEFIMRALLDATNDSQLAGG